MKIISPLQIVLGVIKKTGKPRKFAMNLNTYRNCQYFLLNNSKIKYKQSVADQISNLPRYNKIQITYTLYVGTKRKCDISNILSVTDKYFSDALVELGKIEDDSYLFIPEVIYKYGGYDKNNGRVEIDIQEIKE